mgnify:FL=1
MKHKKKNNKILPVFLLFLLLIAALLVILVAVGGKKEKKPAVSTESTEDTSSDTDKWQEGVISYNGKNYRYNTSIKNYLFLGVDQDGPVVKAKDGISGGQSDAMFLLVADDRNKTLSVIAINRNTMTNVKVYDEDGEYVNTARLQICLQHGYGDGMRVSCLRSVDAVSELFYNLPISGYLSMNMDALPIINDAIGGVTVEVLDDLSNTAKNVSLKKGETVTLTGNEAYVYLRSRDTNVFDSASERLNRQMQYMMALFVKMKTVTDSNPSIFKTINSSIKDYTVSSMDFVRLAEMSADYTFDEDHMYTVPGEMIQGEVFEEYNVDDAALYEMILEIFYEPVY